MNIVIRKFHDTAQRNVWCFQNEEGEIINSKGESHLMNGGWSSRSEAKIVAKQLLRNGKFSSVRYEYRNKDGIQLKTLNA